MLFLKCWSMTGRSFNPLWNRLLKQTTAWAGFQLTIEASKAPYLIAEIPPDTIHSTSIRASPIPPAQMLHSYPHLTPQKQSIN